MQLSQAIAPCLWFDDQGEEAARFYTSIFPNSKVVAVARYSEAGQEVHGKKPGSVMTVEFILNGQPFTALNGGPVFTFNEAVSFQVFCDTQEEIELLQSIAPDVFCAPPTQFRLLVKHGMQGVHLPKLRQCVAAGEPLNPEVIRAWKEATGITIRDGYGQSEAGLLIANLDGLPERIGSMGLPLPGYEIEIIDAAGAVLPPGSAGDIAVRYPAPGLFMGYLNDPDATARCMRGDWYLTGDRGRRDDEGYFWFIGRADDVIISGSHRIGPFEVESLLVEHPAIMEAAATAYPDEDLGHQLAAAIATPTFRPYVAGDMVGAEIGGSVKNVLAIACGIVEGRGLGRSAHAALITRGFAEMIRMAQALGGRAETVAGLCGLGDLVLTLPEPEALDGREQIRGKICSVSLPAPRAVAVRHSLEGAFRRPCDGSA